MSETPTTCTRDTGHDGPCNGWPRAERYGACFQEQTQEAFMQRLGVIKQERGWLIEVPPVPESGDVTIWKASVGWTSDSIKALRFAREEDATAMAKWFGEDKIAVAREHVWG